MCGTEDAESECLISHGVLAVSGFWTCSEHPAAFAVITGAYDVILPYDPTLRRSDLDTLEGIMEWNMHHEDMHCTEVDKPLRGGAVCWRSTGRSTP